MEQNQIILIILKELFLNISKELMILDNTNFLEGGFKIRLNLFTNSFVQQQNNGGIFYLSMSEFERITSQYTYDSNFKNNFNVN